MRISDWSSDVCSSDRKSGGVPWGLRPSFVPKDVNVIPKPLRPIVQIFLIAELAVLETGETPFDAAALPPVSYMFAAMPVKGHELHAILSGGRRLVIFRRIAVVRHQHVRAGLFELGEYRSEEHTSELQSLMRISYAVFCLKKKKNTHQKTH